MKSKKTTRKAQETADLNKLYHEEVKPKILAEKPYCEKCETFRSDVVHHKKGRTGTFNGSPLVIYEPFLMACCTECHNYIHAHSQESYINGWMIKKHAIYVEQEVM